MIRRLLLALGGLSLLVAAVAGYAFLETRRDPVVRRAAIALPDWPAGAAPIRAVLVSDLHLGNAATDLGRLRRIVAQIDALRPDIILIAGDAVAGHAPDPGRRDAARLPQALAALHAPLGVVAVLGNHDHWIDAAAVRRALEASGITVLANQAVARGPLRIAGVDDAFTGHDRPAATLAAARPLPGALVVLSHAPNVLFKLPRGSVLLAGHTHCGQIVLPLLGPLDTLVREDEAPLYDPRLRCGIATVEGRRVVVGAGTGTSLVSLRLGAPPDLWLLTLGPAG